MMEEEEEEEEEVAEDEEKAAGWSKKNIFLTWQCGEKEDCQGE